MTTGKHITRLTPASCEDIQARMLDACRKIAADHGLAITCAGTKDRGGMAIFSPVKKSGGRLVVIARAADVLGAGRTGNSRTGNYKRLQENLQEGLQAGYREQQGSAGIFREERPEQGIRAPRPARSMIRSHSPFHRPGEPKAVRPGHGYRTRIFQS